MGTSGTSNWLSTDQKGNYAYEKYSNDKKSSNPWLKVTYNAYCDGGSNRNTSSISAGANFWLSSRFVGANWDYASFCLHRVSGSGSISVGRVFGSGTYIDSSCCRLRPVLQVVK